MEHAQNFLHGLNILPLYIKRKKKDFTRGQSVVVKITTKFYNARLYWNYDTLKYNTHS